MRLSKADFYHWAYSDLLVNVNRGRFAEYIVATALGVAQTVREEWDAYDLKFNDIKIEVKSSSYIQCWNQYGKISKISFSIRPTRSFDDVALRYHGEYARKSDVYVFCVLRHTDIKTIAPEDTNQWEFYVVPTTAINRACQNQKTISLSSLRDLFNVLPIGYSELKDAIQNAIK